MHIQPPNQQNWVRIWVNWVHVVVIWVNWAIQLYGLNWIMVDKQ